MMLDEIGDAGGDVTDRLLVGANCGRALKAI